jgi:predicted nuclease of predicted toxin-antitoxin system
MRFLVDAQLPPALAVYLVEAGHEAEHVNRIGMGAASDRDVWLRARATSAVLVTKDIDFLELSRHRNRGPAIVWVRWGNITNAALKGRFSAILPELIGALEAGEDLVEVR